MDDLGEELSRQRVLERVFLVLAAAGALVALAVVTGDGDEAPWIAGIVLLLAVVGPLAVARYARRLGYHVSDLALTQTLGERVWREARFSELTSVRVTLTTTLRRRRPTIAVRMQAAHAQGGTTAIYVSGQLVHDLGPLLRRLDAEVDERPALIEAESERARLRAACGGDPAAR